MPFPMDVIRPRVSLAVAGGALFGALYHGGSGGGDPWRGLIAALGAGALCAGCSALNQVQERKYDARMRRTQDRPVASGELSVMGALLIAAVFSVAGLGLFLLAGGWPLLLLGLAVPVIYNGLYTPLKPVTPMALLVGGLSGALPPLTGWVGAGGSLFAPAILGVTIVFYLWQVPHFWLLHEKHREDYERAGFATLGSRLPERFYTPMLCLWVAAYFIGLGCLVAAHGVGALNWLIPPAILLLGGWTLIAVFQGRRRMASAAVYASLPLTLAFLLTNTL